MRKYTIVIWTFVGAICGYISSSAYASQSDSMVVLGESTQDASAESVTEASELKISMTQTIVQRFRRELPLFTQMPTMPLMIQAERTFLTKLKPRPVDEVSPYNMGLAIIPNTDKVDS